MAAVSMSPVAGVPAPAPPPPPPPPPGLKLKLPPPSPENSAISHRYLCLQLIRNERQTTSMYCID